MASAGTKRIMREAASFQDNPLEDVRAAPIEDSLYIWHFTIRQRAYGGLYHGKIVLPASYPLRPPDIYLLTPSGRFAINQKICLSITGYHEESWSPAWQLQQALVALAAYFEEDANGAIGGLDAPLEERQRLAKLSGDWECPVCCVKNKDILAPPAAIAAETNEAEEKAEALPPTVSPAVAVATPPLAPIRSPVWIDRLIVLLLLAIAALLLKRLGPFKPAVAMDT